VSLVNREKTKREWQIKSKGRNRGEGKKQTERGEKNNR
jgi:hypothetical protein